MSDARKEEDRTMNLIELLELGDDLVTAKHTALKKHAIETLQRIITIIENEKYEDIQQFTEYSPAGDSHGRENFYISFLSDSTRGIYWDISDVAIKLKQFRDARDKSNG